MANKNDNQQRVVVGEIFTPSNLKPAASRIVRGGLGLSSLAKQTVPQVKNTTTPDAINGLGTHSIAQPAVKPSTQEADKK